MFGWSLTGICLHMLFYLLEDFSQQLMETWEKFSQSAFGSKSIVKNYFESNRFVKCAILAEINHGKICFSH
jgi:hypothetical protein